MNDEKREREKKTIECERLEFSTRKLEISREYFIQGWVQQRIEMART